VLRLPHRQALPGEHNIAYQEIDIETTPGAADEVVQRTGKRAIPQFVIDGEWVQPYRVGEGFLYDEMARRLGLSSPRVPRVDLAPTPGSPPFARSAAPHLSVPHFHLTH